MIKTAIQESRFLQIQTPFGVNKVFIQSISGWDGFSQLFEYRLTLLAEPGHVLPPKDIVGRAVTVSMTGAGGTKHYINGIVNTFEYSGDDHEQAGYQATIVPWCWILTQRTDCRIFQEKTTPEIIEEVFNKMGMSDFDKSFIQGKYEKREYCVQYRESDWEFVSRLMEEEGIFYFFRHESGKHTLVMSDTKSAYFDLDPNELHYFPESMTSDIGQIHSWRHTFQLQSGKFAMTDYNFKTPSTSLMTDRPSGVGFQHMEKMEVYDYPGRFSNKNLGRQFAQVRMEEYDAGHNVVKATSNYMCIATGGKFTILRHRNRTEDNQKFVVSRTYIHASADEYTTGSASGPAYQNDFECIPATTMFRPRRVTRKPIVEGPQTAVVVGPTGEEIYVDEHSRVKVQFHWDRLGKKDQNSSCWVRVSQAHAGKNWGYIDIPRIGEEVIVSFLEGDPDAPIITGRVYNAENMPPFSLKDGDNGKHKTKRGNKTKTYKGTGYNEMSMDDTPGKELIHIHAQYDMDTKILHDETHWVGNDRTRTVINNEDITIGNSQTITIGSNRSTNIGQNDTEIVGADQTITVGRNQTNTIGANYALTVGGTFQIVISGAVSVDVGGSQSQNISGGSDESVGSKKSLTAGEKIEMTAGMAMELAAGMQMKLNAGAGIKLQCGASSIELTPAMIIISAPLVKIN